MDDIFEKLIADFGNNKKILVWAGILYIVIILCVIIAIWWPEEKNYLEYQNVNIEAKQEVLAKEYVNNISLLFRTGDKEAIKERLSEDYLSYNNKSKDEMIQELEKAGFFSLYSELKGVDLYVDGDTYVYTTTIYYNNNSKKINIIEKYPYVYELAFDDFYKYEEIEKSSTIKGIEFTIEDIYNNLGYLEMNIKITNNNTTYARFDFNSSSCIQAVLEDGKIYSIANNISTSQYTDIEQGTTITKKIIFEIPVQLQSGLEHIVFNGVSIAFAKFNLNVGV